MKELSARKKKIAKFIHWADHYWGSLLFLPLGGLLLCEFLLYLGIDRRLFLIIYSVSGGVMIFGGGLGCLLQFLEIFPGIGREIAKAQLDATQLLWDSLYQRMTHLWEEKRQENLLSPERLKDFDYQLMYPEFIRIKEHIDVCARDLVHTERFKYLVVIAFESADELLETAKEETAKYYQLFDPTSHWFLGDSGIALYFKELQSSSGYSWDFDCLVNRRKSRGYRPC